MTTDVRPGLRATRLPALGLALALAASSLPLRAADAPPSPEYQVKAALLLQTAKFVEWPGTAFPEKESPLTVGVVGRDPFGPILERTFRGETVKGRPVEILRFEDRDDLKPCHVLFVAASEAEHLPEIFNRLSEPAFRAKGPLTLGDLDRFARRGGAIRLVLEEKKIRLHVNPDAADRAGLKISSQLLKLATIVSDEANAEGQGRP